MRGPRLQSLLLLSAALGLAAVALAAFPGFKDELAIRFPVLATLPGWLLWGLADAVVLPKALLTWTLAPWLVALGLACGSQRHLPFSPTEKLAWGLVIGYLALLALSIWTSIYPAAGWEPLFTQGSIMLAALAVTAGLEPAGRRRLLGWSVGTGLLIALYAVLQHLDLDPLAWVPADLVLARSIGTLGNPDYLASYLACLVPLALLPLASSSSDDARWKAAGWGAAGGAILIATVFTYTRGAWVALVVEALILGAVVVRTKGIPTRRFWVGALLVALPLGLLLWSRETSGPHGNNLFRRAASTFATSDHSGATRLSLWRESLEIIGRNPLLGTGPKTFSYAILPYRQYDSPLLKGRVALAGDPHNALLEVAVSSGVPAALLFGGLLALALVRLARFAWRDGDREAGLLLASLAGLCVAHQFVAFTAVTSWMAWLIVGMAMVRPEAGDRAQTRESREEGAEEERGGTGRAATLAVGAVLTLAVGLSCLATAWADYTYNVASQQAEHLLSRTDRDVETSFVVNALHRLEGARRWTLPGPRRVALITREGWILERVSRRYTPEMRRQDGTWKTLDEHAIRLYQDALAENPLDPYSWHNLAGFLFFTGRARLAVPGLSADDERQARGLVVTALATSRQGCRVDPFNAVLWGTHAVRCAEGGEPAEAEEAFKRAISLAPQLVDTRLDLARFLLIQKRPQEARARIEEVLREHPDHERARTMLKECG